MLLVHSQKLLAGMHRMVRALLEKSGAASVVPGM